MKVRSEEPQSGDRLEGRRGPVGDAEVATGSGLDKCPPRAQHGVVGTVLRVAVGGLVLLTGASPLLAACGSPLGVRQACPMATAAEPECHGGASSLPSCCRLTPKDDSTDRAVPGASGPKSSLPALFVAMAAARVGAVEADLGVADPGPPPHQPPRYRLFSALLL